MASELQQLESPPWDDCDSMCHSVRANSDGTVTTEWRLRLTHEDGRTFEEVRKIRMRPAAALDAAGENDG